MRRCYGICFRWPQGNIRWVYTPLINLEIAYDNLEFQVVVRFQVVVQQYEGLFAKLLWAVMDVSTEQAQGAVSLCCDEMDVLRPFEVFTEYDAEVLGLLHVFENDSVECVEFGQLGLQVDMERMTHFDGLKFMPHFSDHSCSDVRSRCRSSWSCVHFTDWYSRQSSAKRHTWDVTFWGRLFMYSRNSKGPRTVPCGTPESTLVEVEDIPSTTTHCVWSRRKAAIHVHVWPSIP